MTVKWMGVAAVLPLFAIMLLGGQAHAASSGEPKAPFKWTSNDHSQLTDANNNTYFPVGYWCGSSSIITNKDATAIDKASATKGTTEGFRITETDGRATKVEVGKCNNEIRVANFLWATEGNPSYAFSVGSPAEKFFDTQYCPVKSGFCTASAIELKDGVSQGTVLFSNDIGTVQGVADAAAAPISADDVVVDDGTNTSPDCQSSGFTLSWIVCPFVDGLAKAVDGMYAVFIKPLLVTSPIDTSGTSECVAADTYKGCDYAVWSEFRIYGNIILVIALLVIVFGQSIGGGLVDAYTAKKVLPRLLAAAILINLSIYIVAFLVDLTNILGGGIQSLLTQPFKDAGAFRLTLNGGTSALGFTAILGAAGSIWAAIAAPAAAVAIGAAILPPLIGFLALFILLPGFFIFIAILATVIIRRGLIIFLVLSAPIAFALYCLPNTETYFKKWWGLLWKTLLIYPIIATIFALADILAITMQQGGSSSGLVAVVSQIMSVVALIIPLFMIPFAFKLAGGIIGRAYDASNKFRLSSQESIKGNANNPDSLRNRSKRNLSTQLANNDLSGQAIGARLNPTTMLGSRRSLRKARVGAIRNMNQGVYGKQGAGAAMYEYNSQDSNITGDLAKFGTSKESRQAIKDEVAAGTLFEGTADHQQRLFSSAAADKIGRTPEMRRKALLNPATIGYEIEDGEAGWKQATGLMHSISGATKGADGQWNGGDEGTYRSMVNEFQYIAKASAGRTDLAGAVDGNPYDFKRGWGSQGLYAIGNGKPRAVRAAGSDFLNQFETAKTARVAKGRPETQAEQEAVEDRIGESGRFYKELQTLSQSSTGAIRDEAVKQMKVFEVAGIQDYLNMEVQSGRTKMVPTMVATPQSDGTLKQEQQLVKAPLKLNDIALQGLRGYDQNPNLMQERMQGK